MRHSKSRIGPVLAYCAVAVLRQFKADIQMALAAVRDGFRSVFR